MIVINIFTLFRSHVSKFSSLFYYFPLFSLILAFMLLPKIKDVKILLDRTILRLPKKMFTFIFPNFIPVLKIGTP